MKCSLSLHGLFALDRNISTGHANYFSTCGKDTLYVSCPPLPTSTSLICGRTIPCILSMWWREDAAITPPKFLVTYPGFILLPKCGPLSHRSMLVHHCPLLAPHKTRGAQHYFGLNNIFYQYHPIENSYHHCQCRLNSDGIVPRYEAVIHIEDNGVLTYCTAKPVVCLLRTAYFQKN